MISVSVDGFVELALAARSFDDVVGTRADAEEFKHLAKVPVEILEKVK